MIGHNLDNPNYWPGEEPGPAIKRNKMDPKKLIALGFKHVKTYTHDEYITGVYENGPLRVEITNEGEKFKSSEMYFSQGDYLPITMAELKVITPILCKK